VRNVDALFARGRDLAATLGATPATAPIFEPRPTGVPGNAPAPAARPRPTPVSVAPPAFDVAGFRARLVATALRELARWEDGKMKESEPRAGLTLQDYWKTGAGRGYSLAQLASKSFQASAPWSAAFISWAMRTAGAGNLFKYSAAHAEYVRAAIANRKANAAKPFKAYRIGELAPIPGDIVTKPRADSDATYDNLRAGAKLHSDIVVEVGPTHVFVVGGNVDNSVKRRRLRLVNGRIAEGGYFSLIRVGGTQPSVTPKPGPTPGPAPAPAPIPTGPAPQLVKRDTVVQGETLYFAIDLKIPGAPARTGVFLPRTFKPGAGVDVVLYLHGHKAAELAAPAIEQYWNAARFPYGALRESVVASGRNVVLVAPTLGPKSQAGALLAPGGFDAFLRQVLAGLRAHGPYRAAPSAPALQNIILACHSGGGFPMRRLAGGRDRAAALIRECWGFDCTYNKGDDVFWAGWGKARPGAKVHIYYIAGSPTAPLAEKLARAAPPNVVVQASREKRHNYVPVTHFEERLRRAVFLASGKSGGGATPPAPTPAPVVPGAEPDPRRMTQRQFIEFVGALARRAKAETGVPASVTVAQAIVETGWGKHSIGDARNLFGIKGRGPAGSIRAKTREFVNGKWITIDANFAKYESFAQSVAEHARLFLRNRVYAKALQVKDDADAFARAIHKAGYATAPNYAQTLIALMKRHDLYRFDR
jgi:hypothetical protein